MIEIWGRMGTILMLPNHFGQITEVEKNELVPQISESMQKNVHKFYKLANFFFANLRKCFQGA
jgi:hypothetical protein